MLPVLRRNGSNPMFAQPTNRLERWFDQVFDDMDRFFGQPIVPAAVAHAFDAVPVSLWEDEDHVYVEAELPGIPRDDIEVTVHNGMLWIKGERKASEDRKYLHNTRTFGRFERFLSLPESACTDNVNATYTDGVLRITLSKKADAKPRRIEIQPTS
jgi:HSP20 family protein